MKSIVALLLAIPSIWARDGDMTRDTMMRSTDAPPSDRRVCYRGAARVAFTENDESPTTYQARDRAEVCPSDDYGCGAVRKFGLSKQYDADNQTFIDDTGVAFSTLDLGCTRSAVCKAITGDEGGSCRYASYNYVRYAPQSCNETRDYDAEYYYRAVKLYFGCCTGDNRCADPSRDSTGNTRAQLDSTCAENEKLGNYLQDLQTCWQAGRETFRRYFLCGDGADLYDYRGSCTNDYGEWSRDSAASDARPTECLYRRTCSTEMLGLLETFAICACNAAKENEYSGRAITALMESNWNDYCPGIDLECDVDNDYAPYIRRRLRQRRIKLRIKRNVDDIDEDEIATLKTKMCDYLRKDCSDDDDEETVTVTVEEASDDSDGTTIRRLVAADPDTESDVYFDVYGDDGFDTAIDTAACSGDDILSSFGDDVTGGEAEVISCDSDDAYIEEYGTDPATTTMDPEGDDTIMISKGFAFGMAIFGYIMQ